MKKITVFTVVFIALSSCTKKMPIKDIEQNEIIDLDTPGKEGCHHDTIYNLPKDSLKQNF